MYFRTTLALIVVVTALTVGGFGFQSLHPLAEEEDLVLEAGLSGTWATDVGGLKELELKIVKAPDTGYSVTWQDESEYRMELTRLGEALFADLSPVESEEKSDLWLPGHLLVRIVLQGDELQAELLNEQWLEDQVASGKFSSSLCDLGDGILLKGPTAQLRSFLLQLSREEDAFDGPYVFRRKE